MKVIVEPVDHIARLWGKQRIKTGETYRLMKYVFRVDSRGKVLLHNVVTGQLVVLNQNESKLIEELPESYSPIMEQLIASHYLVPNDYEEFQQVVNLRKILRGFDAADSLDTLTHYTILPTTACNARCYYCFERGVHSVTMTKEIADSVIRFITDHCGVKKRVSIRWFGGEPTVATQRIDQICNGLQKNEVLYTSSMTTNGYLFDEEMVKRAKEQWRLHDLMICVDGSEKNYNEIKSYISAKDNPYERVLRNVGLLLEQGIMVELRMNFDIGNCQDFREILVEAIKRYHGNELLLVHAFPLKGEYPNKDGVVLHGTEAWFDDKTVELNDMAREIGLFNRKRKLPSLFFSTCSAGTPSSMVIDPEGRLGRCTGIFYKEEQIVGNVIDGITVADYCYPWVEYAEPERCIGCTFFPNCVLIEKCPGRDRCFPKEIYRQYEETIKSVFDDWKNHLVQ